MFFFKKKKIIFEINISKRFKNIKKYFLTKKKLKFEEIRFQPHSQTVSKHSNLTNGKIITKLLKFIVNFIAIYNVHTKHFFLMYKISPLFLLIKLRKFILSFKIK
jgi:hypothetical protein